MHHVDETMLEEDVNARYRYLAEFIGFTDEDIQSIHLSAGYLAPLIPQLVDQTYEKLLAYDATARHFVPRQHGYSGPTPDDLGALTSDHPQIQFRKEHLSRYLMRLVGHAYDKKMVTYLDLAGKMHTPKAGNDRIDVPLVQMNALMGLMSDCLLTAINDLQLDDATKFKITRAFNKLLWIQNDLIGRHYQA